MDIYKRIPYTYLTSPQRIRNLKSKGDMAATRCCARMTVQFFFTKLSPDLLRLVQTHLGGGHLFDGFLVKLKSIRTHVRGVQTEEAS
jgi:hypothetical protein